MSNVDNPPFGVPKSTVFLAIDIKPSILLGLIDTAIRVLNFTTLFPLRPMPVMRAEKRSAKRLADLDSHSREGPSARKREIKGNGSVSGQIKCKDLPCTSTNGRCPMTSPCGKLEAAANQMADNR